MSNDYDVIIVGSGAGGGTLAYRLAPAACASCCSSAATTSSARSKLGQPRGLHQGPLQDTREVDRQGRAAVPSRDSTTTSAGRPSSTARSSSASVRRDFREVRHHGGISPAWPISYADLEPYYAQAEELYFVHGEAGEDPTEPPRRAPYPYPAVSHEPRIQRLHDDFARAGLNPFHLPVGVMLDESNPQASPCIRCSKLDGFPCMVEAKADAHICAVRPALTHPNVTLLTNAHVTRLETDESGTHRHERDRRPRRRARELPRQHRRRLVRRDELRRAAAALRERGHPNGLGNSSGVVGRHYMAHINSALIAISKDPNPTRFQKTLGLNDFYSGADDFELPARAHPDARQVRPRGHQGWRAAARPRASRSTTSPATRSTSGSPPRIFPIRTTASPSIATGASTSPTRTRNLEGHRRLIAKLKGLLAHLGCHPHADPESADPRRAHPARQASHTSAAPCASATIPATSALDVNCKAHDLDNLYVVDTSFFPCRAR